MLKSQTCNVHAQFQFQRHINEHAKQTGRTVLTLSSQLSGCAFQHDHRLSFRHQELRPVACSNIERKYFRIHLRRADQLMAHQTLQYFQQNTVLWRNVCWVTGTENFTPSTAADSTASFSQVRTVRSVISQIRAFSILPVRLLRRSSGIFSVATIISS